MNRLVVALLTALTLTCGTVGAANASPDLKLSTGSSEELILNRPVKVASVVNPQVADIIVRKQHPKRALVQAGKPGVTDIVFKDESGKIIARYQVRVHKSVDALNRALDHMVENGKVRAESIGGSVYLKGSVRDPAVAERVRSIAGQYVNDKNLASKINVTSARQIHLRVRVAEVRRSVSKNLGFDTTAAGSDNQAVYGNGPGNAGINVTDFTGAAAQAALDSTGVGVATELGDASLSTVLEALETKGMVRTLAEPNLTALSGQTADMLAGGEIPIPIPTGDGQVAIEYREFGIGLNFKPTIKENGRISLKIQTSVSTLDDANGVTIQGTTVPAISKRRASTEVEVPSGGGIAIAGLLQNDIESRLEGTPWAQNVPVLGALFSSSNFQADRSELVISVTPYLVRPTDPAKLASPADRIAPPSDADLFLLRRLSRNYAADSEEEPPAAVRRTMGYMLDRTAGGPK